MFYIQQNAARIFRALFEMGVKLGIWKLAYLAFNMCKCIELRFWYDVHPLYQMPSMKSDHLMRLKNFTLDHLYDMEASEISEIVGSKDVGKKIRKVMDQLPYLDVVINYQPLTNSILKIIVKYRVDFSWNAAVHKNLQSYWLFLVDNKDDIIHHCEHLVVSIKDTSYDYKDITFHIPFPSDSSKQYYLYILPEKWLNIEQCYQVNSSIIYSPCDQNITTNLFDLNPLPVSVLNNERYQSFYSYSYFNPIQTQVFYQCYHTNENLFIGAPTGSGKTTIAEFCIFHLFNASPSAKAVYIAPMKALVRERVEDWQDKFMNFLGKKIIELTGDTLPDMQMILESNLIITTPEKWDAITRLFKYKKYISSVELIIIDEIHLLGEERGSALESIISRTQYISTYNKMNIRIVGLSTAISNAQDLGRWLNINKGGLYNFSPSVRPIPIQIHISGYPGQHYCPRMATMNKPVYSCIQQYSDRKPVLIFVSSRRQTRLTALALIAFSSLDNPEQFINFDEKVVQMIESIKDETLKQTIQFGIGIHHAGINIEDRKIVEELFRTNKILILISTSTLAWGVNLPAHLVILKGTEYFEKTKNVYVDYSITDILQMIGRAGRPQFDKEAIACILVQEEKKTFYKKFLYEPFPVESTFLKDFPNHINAEISIKSISNMDECFAFLSTTYLFQRISRNPTYYGMETDKIEDINKKMKELIKSTLELLKASECITVSNTYNLVKREWRVRFY